MPSDLRLTQDIIIEILVFCDFSLQRDIFAHIKSAAVEQQCGQQAAHSAVSIIEGMNAEKVVDEHRNDDQWLHFHVPNDPIVLLADPVQGLRRFIGSQWRKQGLHMAVGIGGADVVLHVFGPARHGVVHVAVEDLVELQDVVLCNRDGVKVLMDEVQHIPVTCNLSSTSCRIRVFVVTMPSMALDASVLCTFAISTSFSNSSGRCFRYSSCFPASL